MSVNVQFSLGNLPVGYCWPGPNQYAIDVIALLTGTVPTAGKIIIGPNAPAPADQDGVWVRTSGGFLEGVYLFQGVWARPHPIAPASKERMIWTDTEANLWAYGGGDGTNPSITAPTLTTGAMWQRDLVFGADDGSSIFKIPVGIGLNPTAYDGNPATSIGVAGTGGEQRHKLLTPELPSASGFPAAVTGVWSREPGSGTTLLTSQAGNSDGLTLPTAGTDKSHENMPPYIGVIFAKRTVRQFLTAS